VGINHKGINKKWYSHKKKVFKYREINQPNSVPPKITGSKLKSDV